MYRQVNNNTDRDILQEDLNRLLEWSAKWQIQFNPTKCHVLQLGAKNQEFQYSVGNAILESVRTEKDLGVTIDKELKFHDHVAIAVNKASRMLGLIKHAFTCLDKYTLPRLYKVMVRPHLEYGNIIWHPRFVMDEKEVEKVQRRATKLVDKVKELTCGERLQQLKLPSLQYRRRCGDMIQVYTIMNGLERNDKDLFFEVPKVTTTRGNSQRVYKRRCNTALRSNVFSSRIYRDWSSLSEQIVEAQTIDQFKNRLESFWKCERYTHPFI